MKPLRIAALMALVVSSLVAHAAPASGPKQFEQMCRERYAKLTATPEASFKVRYVGRNQDGRHAVTGTAIIHGKEQPVQCLFGDQVEPMSPPKK